MQVLSTVSDDRFLPASAPETHLSPKSISDVLCPYLEEVDDTWGIICFVTTVKMETLEPRNHKELPSYHPDYIQVSFLFSG